MSKNLQPSEELTTFLNDEATLGEIEKVEDKQDILVRWYDCLSLHYISLLVVVVGIVLVVVIVTSCVTLSTKRGCCQEHDSIRGCRCNTLQDLPCHLSMGPQNGGLPWSRQNCRKRTNIQASSAVHGEKDRSGSSLYNYWW